MDFACVPDIRFEPVSTVTDGPRLVTEMRITGINTGPTVLGEFGKILLGADAEEIPASGRPIDLPAVFAYEVRDDLVVAERQYWGLLEFLVQTGFVGGPAGIGGAARPLPHPAARLSRNPRLRTAGVGGNRVTSLATGARHVGHRRADAGRWLPLLRVAVPSGAARSS